MLCRVLEFCVILVSNFIVLCVCRKMNTKRNTGTRVREVAAGGNQAPHQAPACGVQVPINPAALTDGEVRAALVQMSLAITAHEYAITAQDTKEGSPTF